MLTDNAEAALSIHMASEPSQRHCVGSAVQSKEEVDTGSSGVVKSMLSERAIPEKTAAARREKQRKRT